MIAEARQSRPQRLILPDDAHNRSLIESVHPAAWKNPTPGGRYNLVVIGGGTAGLVCAAGAAGLGAKVALVERHLLGGDCLNFGCVPSKGLLRASRAAHAVREAPAFGVRVGAVAPDFAEAMARMRELRARIAPHDSAKRMSELGVDVYLGEARFAARDAIEVAGQRLSFARAVLATGARASSLPIPGLADAGFLTNETVFSLTELPRRLVVIGGGPIGCELSQAFRRLGSEVTMVDRAPRLLPRDDEDAAAVLAKRFAEEGIATRLSAKLLRVERNPGGKVVSLERDGRTEDVQGDEILVAIGRAPNVEGLGLDVAGVAIGKGGVQVDDRLRTTNPRVYAAGDVCSAWKFTHAADAMARIVLQNVLFFGCKRTSALVIPWCTYTDPEIAHVGIDRPEAERRGALTFTVPLGEVDRAVLDREAEGFARVHLDRGGRLLGATMVASHAGEMIGEMSLALTAGLSMKTVGATVHPYPTQAEAWKKLGDQWARTRLTPRAHGVLERVLRWRR